jgi:hypothetical protein
LGEEPAGTAPDRAIAADIADLADGQYRYAVFARYLESGLRPVTNPRLRWSSVLRRGNPGEFAGEQNFVRLDGTAGATIRIPTSMAMLDCLAEKSPLGWDELVQRTATALKGKRGALNEDEQNAMRIDLRILWRLGLLLPSAKLDG